MATVVTFGELMLRLRPPGHQRLSQANALEASFGGGEANVAASLARFGHTARWVSAVPASPVGDWALGELAKVGIDTSRVLRQGNRLGIYFLEVGASQRSSQVVYDRAGSSISAVQPGEVHWERVLEGASWFHTTGITPALSPSAAAVAREGLQMAKRLGLTTSVDLNYRRKLWSVEEARQVMTELMEHTDIVIANEEDCDCSLGIRATGADVVRAEVDAARYVEVAQQVLDRFPQVRQVGITLRESVSASMNGWSALLADRQGHSLSRRYEIQIVDRVGAGDAFAAGLIHARLAGKPRQDAVELAAAASALKHSIVGDLNLVTLAEVERLVGGDGSGRVAR
jgi:2-dehydro-3-deoxygluconokinase